VFRRMSPPPGWFPPLPGTTLVGSLGFRFRAFPPALLFASCVNLPPPSICLLTLRLLLPSFFLSASGRRRPFGTTTRPPPPTRPPSLPFFFHPCQNFFFANPPPSLFFFSFFPPSFVFFFFHVFYVVGGVCPFTQGRGRGQPLTKCRVGLLSRGPIPPSFLTPARIGPFFT